MLSIYAGVNAMTWLRVRPRLFMMQVVVAEKALRAIIELVSPAARVEREWMAQWRRAGAALAQVRADELACLTAGDALAATDALLALAADVPLSVERLTWSGLVELQRYLHHSR